ncbi:MAG: leucyl aminopeptidase [Elusimicrobia bacterium]|nr:leucyl aminopeptidase [Elusimicrobiota bacterium]
MIKLTTALQSSLKGSELPTALFCFEEGPIAGAKPVLPAQRKAVLDQAKADGFKGGLGDCASFSSPNFGKLILVGLGKKGDYDAEALRRAAAGLFHYAKGRFARIAVFPADNPQAAAEGLILASYRFLEYKKGEEEKLSEAVFIAAQAAEKNGFEKALSKAALHAEAVCLARDLVNRGPSDKTPQAMAEIAKSLDGSGIKVSVISRAKAQELGMGSFLGVARGSAHEPAFVHLVYKPQGPARKRLGLVGKGITFDSGGLSLKPPQHMETMKMDMAGAASVLAVFKVLPRLKARAEVHGFCAFTYNMPGPDAMKPGDVIKAMNGKTIEVLNTDAEGRLILADALAYASRQKLDALIDLATLTGAVVTALGSKVTGAMTNNPALLRQLLAASAKTQEAVCELPLVKDYKDQIKSSIADLQNIGKARGEAGSIIGGLFLQEFVDGAAWVHLDIAGTAWTDAPSAYCPAGGTGSMVRTLIEYLAAL